MTASSDEDEHDNLSLYRAKRTADSTTEPMGTVSSVPGRNYPLKIAILEGMVLDHDGEALVVCIVGRAFWHGP